MLHFFGKKKNNNNIFFNFFGTPKIPFTKTSKIELINVLHFNHKKN